MFTITEEQVCHRLSLKNNYLETKISIAIIFSKFAGTQYIKILLQYTKNMLDAKAYTYNNLDVRLILHLWSLTWVQSVYNISMYTLIYNKSFW